MRLDWRQTGIDSGENGGTIAGNNAVMAFQKHDRKSIRLANYVYSRNGYYFVTVCTQKHRDVFGYVLNNKIILNEFGKIVEKCWHDLPNHYKNVKLGAFVIMPDHIHGIIIINNADNFVGAGFKPAPTSSNAPSKLHGLSEIIRGFKTFSAKRINEFRNIRGFPVWQRNYFEHVIRNECELGKIRMYINTNVVKHKLKRPRIS
ncbi:MAG: transposase [Candidatus Margulisiibacteriota bacterium]